MSDWSSDVCYSDLVLEGGFGGDALGRCVRVHVARVLAAGEAVEALADAAVARHQLDFLQRQQVAHQGDAVARQGRAQRLANAPDDADRLVGQEALRRIEAQPRKATRLVEVGGALGEELVVAEADRGREATVPLDPERK